MNQERLTTQPQLLVVDDEPRMAELVAEVGGQLGFAVTQLHDPVRFSDDYAIAFDVIVMDLVMPGVDGIELLRRLAERDCKAALVLISGYDEAVLNTARELAGAHGLNVAGHLSKPFRVQELKGILQRSADPRGPAPRVRTAQRTLDAAELARALRLGQVCYHYQPQIDLATDRVKGFEALARWNHPVYGLVGPAEFIPLAEAEGLIDALTWELLAGGVTDLAALNAGTQRYSLAVNVSTRSLCDLALPDKLQALCARHGVAPAALIIEITESGIIEELDRGLDVIARCRMKGFRLSIDDFGTGSATLEQLRRVPITELKVDRSFVAEYLTNRKSRLIAQHTIELGRALGLHVVAEGIEQAAIADALRAAGCDTGQGYLYSRPLARDALEQWLDARRRAPQALDVE